MWKAVSPISSGSNTTTILEALEPGTAYKVRIRAVSVIGNGEWTMVGELPIEVHVMKLLFCINVESCIQCHGSCRIVL